MINLDIYNGYADLNAEIDRVFPVGSSKPGPFDADNCVEHHDLLIVGIRKWCWDGGSERGPDIPILGYEFAMYLGITEKYDVFIYTRG